MIPRAAETVKDEIQGRGEARAASKPALRTRRDNSATRARLAEKIVAEAILAHLELCGWRMKRRRKAGVTPVHALSACTLVAIADRYQRFPPEHPLACPKNCG
jgi:hypothetical protein